MAVYRRLRGRVETMKMDKLYGQCTPTDIGSLSQDDQALSSVPQELCQMMSTIVNFKTMVTMIPIIKQLMIVIISDNNVSLVVNDSNLHL